jgi:sigma-B regulation protein RsbU (phosphoserine phosphatase)
MFVNDFRCASAAETSGVRSGNGSAARRRLRSATDVQRALLPPSSYVGTLAEAAAVTQPRWAVGGDFYDYVDTGRDFRIILGDACGKGTAAALQAAVVQGVLATEPEAEAGPAQVMTRLNQALCRRMVPARFVTLFYGILSPDHRLRYCNAGLCRPLLLNRSSVHRLATGGPPLGLWSTARFEETSRTLHPGDLLAACSDGILDAEGVNGNGAEEFGERRVLDVVWRHREKSTREIVESLVAAVGEFSAGTRPHDDMTAVVVRYRA